MQTSAIQTSVGVEDKWVSSRTQPNSIYSPQWIISVRFDQDIIKVKQTCQTTFDRIRNLTLQKKVPNIYSTSIGSAISSRTKAIMEYFELKLQPNKQKEILQTISSEEFLENKEIWKQGKILLNWQQEKIIPILKNAISKIASKPTNTVFDIKQVAFKNLEQLCKQIEKSLENDTDFKNKLKEIESKIASESANSDPEVEKAGRELLDRIIKEVDRQNKEFIQLLAKDPEGKELLKKFNLLHLLEKSEQDLENVNNNVPKKGIWNYLFSKKTSKPS